ncbi:putative bifunctional diguanylate cyclase/phosphodiesterase [Aquabacter spiritensis]|uniref:Periplasmic sensor diguanylate cyclase/phosphodiesterase n=1 Tax=Aquabacter spiritensis TaxID=933073 RepID=A0A4R3LPM8_9HYPH|nr:EAL domain-containing protein [Aquabacter spiritensis]TCT02434.1 periplasmic sensor diguanylate cyclase/phosphodiesterase [Aquabacter spiritensis]
MAVAIVLAALVGLLVVAVVASDQRIASRERAAVTAILAERAGIMQRSVNALLQDEDIVRRVRAGDIYYVHQRLGAPLNDRFGYERTVLLEQGSGAAVYGSVDGSLLDERALAAMAPTFRGALQNPDDPRTGFIVDDRGMGFAVVVKGGEGAPDIICIAVDAVDAGFLHELEERLQVSGLHIVPGKADSAEERGRVALASLSGDVALTLSWTPPAGAVAAIGWAAPWVAALSTLLLAICSGLLIRAWRSRRALAESEARAKYLAFQDYLTGLANRGHFIERLQVRLAALAPGQSLVLLFLDLDGFKDINDTLGHAVGDTMLRMVAKRIEGCLGGEGLAARFGGDEFVLFTLQSPEEGGGTLISDLLAAIQRPFQVDGRELLISVSIGAAFAPAHASDASELIQRADMALYRAKTEGRAGFRIFEPSLEVEMRKRRQVEQELAEGISKDHLTLVFQPQVDVESERIIGFETLVRWNHPVRGLILPEAFIPVAERSRLINRLDAWVLRKACTLARDLPEVTISVNMSAASLREPDIAERMIAVLAQVGFDPDRLEVEITESAVFQSEGRAHEALLRLRDAGVRIALDDFGTGHASLVHIRSMPVTKIKIDRSFIMNLGIERDAAAIVEYVVRLGRSLGMVLTAEGVETREQLRFLRAFGTQQAQGYLFSPPVPIEEAQRLLAAQSAGQTGAERHGGPTPDQSR